MMHHEITFFFLHQTRPSSANVAISCGLTSRIFQNLPEPGKKEQNNCSRVVTTNKTGVHSHQATSFITHIIMMGFRLGKAEAYKVPNRALFCASSWTKSCSFLQLAVHQILLFSAFRRAQNRAVFCVSSCSKSCSFLRFVVLQIVLFQIVLFSEFFVVQQIVLFSVSSCAKLCPKVSVIVFAKALDQGNIRRTVWVGRSKF